jgi:hypothetical protein
MERLVQFATSIAFLLLCLIGSGLGVKALLAPPPTRIAGPVQPPRPQPAPTYAVGEPIKVAGVDFRSAEQTLVLVVRKGCRFCDESMPFYKQLGDDIAIKKTTRLVIAAPDDEVVSREELAKQAVRVDQVVKVKGGELKVRGTPTAILVDRGGTVRQVLVGRLDETKQRDLIAALRTPARP